MRFSAREEAFLRFSGLVCAMPKTGLERYTLLGDRLAKGGYGIVYAAMDAEDLARTEAQILTLSLDGPKGPARPEHFPTRTRARPEHSPTRTRARPERFPTRTRARGPGARVPGWCVSQALKSLCHRSDQICAHSRGVRSIGHSGITLTGPKLTG